MADMGIRQPRLQIAANVHRARLDNVRLPFFSFNRLDGDNMRDKQSNAVSIQCRLSTCGALDGSASKRLVWSMCAICTEGRSNQLQASNKLIHLDPGVAALHPMTRTFLFPHHDSSRHHSRFVGTRHREHAVGVRGHRFRYHKLFQPRQMSSRGS